MPFVSLDPVQLSLVLLLAAAAVLYVGTRLLWSAVPAAGLWRGVAMGGPLIALALSQAPATPGTAVALLVGGAVLATTLGLGVSTIDLPTPDAEGSPVLRTLLPLAAVTCLVGFHGTLRWWHAAALAAVGGLTLWTADGERRRETGAAAATEPRPDLHTPGLRYSEGPDRDANGAPTDPGLRRTSDPASAKPRGVVPLGVAVFVIACGLAVLVVGVRRFSHAAGTGAFTPTVVLLSVPAVLLALLGLLTAEARDKRPDTPHETVAGLAAACLGVGLPLVIVVALASSAVIGAVQAGAATRPATQSAGPPAVVMPLATWRIDTVLLVVVTALLVPVGFGQFRVGRAEGAWLIVIYLAYAAVATRVGAAG